MRTIHRSFLVTLAAVVAAACSETATTPVVPEPLLSHADGGHRVVGSGHVQAAAGLREFTFHAVEAPDGSVSGSFKIVLPNGLFLEVDVECMAVEGNTGWVSGRIRESNAGFIQIGAGSMFYAVDNGEGGATADVVSTAAINTPEAAILEFCAEKPLLLPPMTVTDGNVQVR